MTKLPTCAVRALVYDSEGAPVAGALVTAMLSVYEVYEGFVVPQRVSATTNADGVAILDLWPNQLGSAESHYDVKINGAGKTLRMLATVPNQPAIDLHLIAELPPYEGKSDGQLAIEEAINAAASAIAARDAALAAQAGSEGTALASAAAAATANTAAAEAQIDSAAAAGSAVLAQKWATQTAVEVAPGQGYGALKYALDAAGHASSADASKQAAANSADEAYTSAGLASQWATATALPVAGTDYGAKKYALDAQGAATAAALSETHAAASEDSAKAWASQLTTPVADELYSARYYAQAASDSVTANQAALVSVAADMIRTQTLIANLHPLSF